MFVLQIDQPLRLILFSARFASQHYRLLHWFLSLGNDAIKIELVDNEEYNMKKKRIQVSLLVALTVLLFAVVSVVMQQGGVARDDFHVVEGLGGKTLFLSHGDRGSFRIARIPIAELD